MTHMNSTLYTVLSQMASQQDYGRNDDFGNALNRFDHLNRHNQLAMNLMRKADRNCDGRVSAKELRKFVHKLMAELDKHCKPNSKNPLDCIDKNGDGKISYPELKAYLDKLNEEYNQSQDDTMNNTAYCPPISAWEKGGSDKNDMMRMTSAFDRNSDGKLNRDEYNTTMGALGIHDRVAQNGIWNSADADKSGTLESPEMAAFYDKLLGKDGRYTRRDAGRVTLSENIAHLQSVLQAMKS